MSSVSIYADVAAIPTFEHGHLRIDDNTILTFPSSGIDRAEWCRTMADLLAGIAQDAITSAEADVKNLRAAAASVPGSKAGADCSASADRIQARIDRYTGAVS